jgi:hypothetical protein
MAIAGAAFEPCQTDAQQSPNDGASVCLSLASARRDCGNNTKSLD